MLAQAIARPLDLQHDGMMQKAVEERGGDDEVAEDVSPLGEAAVRGEDHGAPLITGVDELEEQIAAARNDREVADFVDNEQGEAAEVSDSLAQSALAFGPGERGDDVGEGAEVDAAASFHRLDAERQAEMGLAGAGWTDQVDGLGAIDELGIRRAP